MEAKKKKSKNSNLLTKWEAVLIETLYQSVYKPLCTYPEFFCSRVAVLVIQVACLSLCLGTTQVLEISMRSSQTVSLTLFNNEMQFNWRILIAAQIIEIVMLSVYLILWIVQFVRNYLEYTQRFLFIKNCFEIEVIRRITFFIMTLAGPSLIMTYLINILLMNNLPASLADSQLFVFLNSIILPYIFIFGIFGLALSLLTLCDKPSKHSYSVRAGTLFLFYENMGLVFSVVLTFFKVLNLDLLVAIIISQVVFTLLRWIELVRIPFNNLGYNCLTVVLLACENILGVMIAADFWVTPMIWNFTGLSLFAIGMITLIGGRIGVLLDMNFAFKRMLIAEPQTSIGQIRVFVWFISEILFLFENTILKSVFSNTDPNQSMIFSSICYIISHRKICMAEGCPCSEDTGVDLDRLKTLNHSQASVSINSIQIKSLLNTIYQVLMYNINLHCTSKSEQDQIHYTHIHWLVHVEKNFSLAMTRISELLVRNTSFFLKLRLSLIQMEIKIFERSQAIHAQDYLEHQQELYRVLDSEKQYKIAANYAMKLMRNFEKLSSHYSNSNILFDKIEQSCLKMVTYETKYMESVRTYRQNLKIQWFHDLFRFYFLSKFTKYSVKQEIKVSQPADENSVQFTRTSFYLLVQTESRSLGIISACSKNIEQLLGINRNAVRGISINHFIPSPLNSFHDQFLENSLHSNAPSIMDKLRDLFIINERGFIVPVTLIVKRNFDYRNSGFHFFAYIEKVVLKSEIIFCRQDGLISAMSSRVSNLFGGNGTEVVHKLPLQHFVPFLRSFFDDAKRKKADEVVSGVFQQAVDQLNSKLTMEKVYLFLRPPKAKETHPSTVFKSQLNLMQPSVVEKTNGNPLAVVFSALHLRTHSTPKRYSVKLKLQIVDSQVETFFLVRLTSIKPAYMTNAHLKSKCISFIYRMTLLKLFIRAWCNKTTVDVLRVQGNRRSIRKESTFKFMLKNMQSSNMLLHSAILASEVPPHKRNQSDKCTIKTTEYVPIYYKILRYMGLGGTVVSLISQIIILILVATAIQNSYPYINIAFSESKFLLSTFSFLSSKQMRLINPNDNALSIMKTIEMNGVTRVLTNIYNFQNASSLFQMSDMGNGEFEFDIGEGNYDRRIETNLFDSMLLIAYHLNRTSTPKIVATVSELLSDIQASQEGVESINPLVTILDNIMKVLIIFCVTTFATLAVYIVTSFIINGRLIAYRNRLYGFGTKIIFTAKQFSQIDSFRAKLGLAAKNSVDAVKGSNDQFSTQAVHVSKIRFNVWRFLVYFIFIGVMFWGFTAFTLVWQYKFSAFAFRLVEVKNLLIMNSYEYSLAIHRILNPKSPVKLNEKRFLERLTEQNKLMFNYDSDLSDMAKYKAQFQGNLCALNSMKQYTFCPLMENGLLKNNYLIASNYMIKNIPQWLAQGGISNTSEVFQLMTLMRFMNNEFQNLIGEISLNHFLNSLVSLRWCFVVSLCLHVLFLILLQFELLDKIRQKNMAAFRVVWLLKPKIIYANSKIKAFVDTVNQSY